MAERRARVRADMVDGVSKPAKKASNAFSKFGKALAIGAIARGAARALSFLSESLGEAAKAAADAEQSFGNVQQSLRNAGESTAAAEGIREFSKSLQDNIGIAKEQIEQGFILAQSFGQSEAEARKLATTAADFAQGAGLNYIEAVRRLGRATQGSTDDVAKFAPAIRDLTRAQLAAGEATDLLAAKFSGAAKAALDNYAGSLTRVKLAEEDLKQARGLNIITNEAQIQAIDLTTQQLQVLAEQQENLITIEGTLSAALTTANLLWLKTREGINIVFDATARYAGGVKEAIEPVKEMTTATESLEKRVGKLLKTWGAFDEPLRRFAAAVLKENDALARADRITKELAAQTLAFEAAAKATGFTVETELTAKIKSLNDFLELTRQKTRDQTGSLEELARVEAFVAEQTQLLKDEINGVTEAQDRQTTSSGDAVIQQQQLQETVNGTAASYDRLSDSLQRANDLAPLGGGGGGNSNLFP